MKIAFLIPGHLKNMGGAQIFVHNIVSNLKKQGHEAIVVTSSRNPFFKKPVKNLGYPVLTFNPFVNKFLWKIPSIGKILFNMTLKRLQKRYKFNIWQVTIGYPLGVYAVDFFKENNIPCVLRCSGEDIQKDKSIPYGYRLDKNIDVLVRKTYPKYDALVALSDTVRKLYLEIGVRDDKIHIIPNGVDVYRISSFRECGELKKKMGLENKKMILAVGRNHPKKGYNYIPKIIKSLLKYRDDFVWVLIGRDTGVIKEMASREGVGKYIITIDEIGVSKKSFLVPSEELIKYYKAADVFAFPTIMETFGMVLIEAMAAGLPVVSTKAPGCNNVVKDGYNGLFVPVGDCEAMAETINKIFSNTELKNKLIENALTDVKENYDWEIIANQYYDLYKKLCATSN